MVNEEFLDVDEKIIVLSAKGLEKLILSLKVCVEGCASNENFKKSKCTINNKSIYCEDARLVVYDFIKILQREMN